MYFFISLKVKGHNDFFVLLLGYFHLYRLRASLLESNDRIKIHLQIFFKVPLTYETQKLINHLKKTLDLKAHKGSIDLRPSSSNICKSHIPQKVEFYLSFTRTKNLIIVSQVFNLAISFWPRLYLPDCTSRLREKDLNECTSEKATNPKRRGN